jgi:hypothetical protein
MANNGSIPSPGQIIVPDEIAPLLRNISPEGQANALALAGVRQAIFDTIGAYPARNVMPYAYSFELSQRLSTQVAANGTSNASIKVTADAAFIARYITGVSTGAYLLNMRVDASDRQLNNIMVNNGAFVGTAERPNILPKALLLPANSTISFDITDISGQINNVYFTLIGYKIYGFVAQG